MAVLAVATMALLPIGGAAHSWADDPVYVLTDTSSGALIGGYDTLQAAVDGCSANGSCTITVNADDPAIATGTDVVSVANGIDLVLTSAPGQQYSLYRAGGQSARHIDVAAGATLTINHLIIDGAGSPGGIDVEGKLVLEDGAVVTRCGPSPTGSGGGVAVLTGGEAVMNDGAAVTNNIAATTGSSGRGGGVSVYGPGSVFTLNGGVISGNMAVGGDGLGGLGGGVDVDSATFYMNGGEISGNTANASSTRFSYGQGGGVHIGTGLYIETSFIMTGGTISGNTASVLNNSFGNRGGGVSSGVRGVIKMSGGTITGNLTGDRTAGDGGGIWSQAVIELSGTATITNNAANTGSTLTGNGGGVMLAGASGASLTILGDHVTITGNQAPNGLGGGIYIDNTSAADPVDIASYSLLKVDASATISGNTANATRQPPINAGDFTTLDGWLLDNDNIIYKNTDTRVQYRLDGVTWYGTQVAVAGQATIWDATGLTAPVGRPNFAGWKDSAGVTYDAGFTVNVPSSGLVLYAAWLPDKPVIVSPAQGDVVESDYPLISGTGTSGGSVQVMVDGTHLLCTAEIVDGLWSCRPDEPLADGVHVLTALTKVDDVASGWSDRVSFTIAKAPETGGGSDGEGETDGTGSGDTAQTGGSVQTNGWPVGAALLLLAGASLSPVLRRGRAS